MATLFQPSALLLGQIPWQIQDARQRHGLIAFLKGHGSAAFADVGRMALSGEFLIGLMLAANFAVVTVLLHWPSPHGQLSP